MKRETLIIDDDEISVMLTELVLEDTKCFENLRSFSDGTQALEYLKNEYSQDTFYVVFLDINMPFMNGWEFLEEIKKFTSKHNISVVMLSSSTDQDDIEYSKNFDLVKGYFSKPLKANQLTEVQKFIS